jgi:hypothetical protein
MNRKAIAFAVCVGGRDKPGHDGIQMGNLFFDVTPCSNKAIHVAAPYKCRSRLPTDLRAR